MPTPILMPALSPTMEEGKLAKWLVKEGQKVRAGDVIAEIETDKATMEVEAVDEGTVGRLLIGEGTDKVKVNTPIAVLLEEGESASALGAVTAAPASSGSTQSASQKSSASAAPPAAATKPAVKEETVPRSQSVTSAPAQPNGHAEARIFASPLARRLAREGKLDLARLQGSGPHGRIIKRDVDAALKGGGAQRVPAAPVQSTAITTSPATATAAIQAMPDDKVLALYETGSYEVVPHDGMRRVIAQRLTQSKQTIPHFYMSVDCRLDTLLAARERINKIAPKEGPRAYKLSVNDFVIKALALALQRVPEANVSWSEGGMLKHKHSDVGVAVALPGGLITPIIRQAETKSLSAIANDGKDLIARARAKKLKPNEYQGGTTSVSNLGMYGIKEFTAVINPPQSTILAVGAGEERAVARNGKIEAAHIMTVTLSCDHRAVDGALGAELIRAFKTLIENPVMMIV